MSERHKDELIKAAENAGYSDGAVGWGVSRDDAIQFAILLQLKRIADALEPVVVEQKLTDTTPRKTKP